MQRVTIQQIWNEAWKRFWRNWIPAITLLPVPLVLGAIVAGLSGWGITAAWFQMETGESWTKITAFLLLIVYLGLAIIGITIFVLGADQIALSIARKGIYRLRGDVLPSNPLVVFLNFLLLRLIYAVLFLVAAIALAVVGGILSFIFVGRWNSLDDLFGAGAIAPVFVLLALALLAAFYVLIWPADYLLLSGHNAISAISESFRFMRRHWEVVIAFDVGRLFVLFFSMFMVSVVGVSALIPSFGSFLSKEMDFISFGSSGTSTLTAFLAIIAFLFILIFLILMRAVAFTMLYEEGQEEEQALAPVEETEVSQAPSYPYPGAVSPPAQEPPREWGYQG